MLGLVFTYILCILGACCMPSVDCVNTTVYEAYLAKFNKIVDKYDKIR